PRRDDRVLEATVGSVLVVVERELCRAVARIEGDDRVDEWSERGGVDVELDGRSCPGRNGPIVHVPRRVIVMRADLAGAGVADRDWCSRARGVVGLLLR